MDDHFSIETHGELGNLGILDFGNPPLRRSVFKDLNMTLGLIQMQMQSHCDVLVGKKHSSCNCVTNTGMQPHVNTCKHMQTHANTTNSTFVRRPWNHKTANVFFCSVAPPHPISLQCNEFQSFLPFCVWKWGISPNLLVYIINQGCHCMGKCHVQTHPNTSSTAQGGGGSFRIGNL